MKSRKTIKSKRRHAIRRRRSVNEEVYIIYINIYINK